MNQQLKILLLEDTPEDIDLVERELRRGAIDFSWTVVKTRDEYERALNEFRPDIILSDHSLPQFNSIEAMQVWKQHQRDNNVIIPFILLTGSVSEEFAVQTIKAGADDYILKDGLKRLPTAIRSAMDKARLEKERISFIAEIISQSALMKEAEHLANFGSWEIDLASGKHRWSDEAFRIFGFLPGEIDPDNEKFFMHVHPDDKEMVRQMITGTNNLAFREIEYRITDNTGQTKHLLSRIMVRSDDDKSAGQLVGFTMDITSQKLQNQALELQNQKLMEIAWVQSHEVRGPLARLIGLAQLLDRHSAINPELKDSLSNILASARELDGIIRKIVRKTEEIA